MDDEGEGTFTEVTGTDSYCERMQQAFCGVCVGILLFFGSWPLLFWNEGRAVRRQQDLDEGRGIVQQVGLTAINATIDKALDTKLVYVTGLVDGGNADLYDPILKLNVTNLTKAISYSRDTEMYQWYESKSTRKEKTSGGGTKDVTSYSYSKQWRSTLISSSSFRQQSSTRVNPTSFLIEDFSAKSSDIGLGPYTIDDLEIINQINWAETWTDAPVNTSLLNFTGYTTTFSFGTLKIQKTANVDTVGDNRATLEITSPDTVSVVARQSAAGKLEPYPTETGNTLLLFSRGTQTSDELFTQAEEDNTMWTWILRFVGFLVMVIGISMILNPIAVAFDVLPFCGDALEGAIGGCIIPCIAVCISLPLSLLIISIAWIFYRPYFAIGTVVMLALLGFFYCKYIKPKLEQKPQSAGGGGQQQNFAEENPEKPIPAQPYGGEEVSKNDVPFGQALENPPPTASGGGGGYAPP